MIANLLWAYGEIYYPTLDEPLPLLPVPTGAEFWEMRWYSVRCPAHRLAPSRRRLPVGSPLLPPLAAPSLAPGSCHGGRGCPAAPFASSITCHISSLASSISPLALIARTCGCERAIGGMSMSGHQHSPPLLPSSPLPPLLPSFSPPPLLPPSPPPHPPLRSLLSILSLTHSPLPPPHQLLSVLPILPMHQPLSPSSPSSCCFSTLRPRHFFDDLQRWMAIERNPVPFTWGPSLLTLLPSPSTLGTLAVNPRRDPVILIMVPFFHVLFLLRPFPSSVSFPHPSRSYPTPPCSPSNPPHPPPSPSYFVPPSTNHSPKAHDLLARPPFHKLCGQR